MPQPDDSQQAQQAPAQPYGLRWLGGVGIALAELPAAAPLPPGLWQHVDAVLDLGSAPRPSGCSPPQQGGPRGRTTAAVRADGCAAQNVDAEAATSGGRDGSADAEQLHVAATRGSYMWQHVRSAKAQRGSLLAALPAALRFAGRQLAARRRLLIASDEGLDAPACVAIAALLAFYEPPGDGESGDWAMQRSSSATACHGGTPQPQTGGCGCCDEQRAPAGRLSSGGSSGGGCDAGSAVAATAAEAEAGQAASAPLPAVHKADLRRCLAFVSGQCPEARPPQGMLKQVFNHFEIASGNNRHFRERQSQL